MPASDCSHGRQYVQCVLSIGGEPAQRGIHVITTSRAQLGSIVSLVADASLTALSDRVHRGSLTNARAAIEERMAVEAGSQALIREFEARGTVHRFAATS
jgi:hypothetical protein